MASKISFEDVILETLPFAEELKQWCKQHSEFYKALKVVCAERFIHLGGIITSYSQNYPKDEVIGLISYDYKLKKPMFKQDFIINKEKMYKEFLLFTRSPFGSSRWVKDINEFYKTYGKVGLYLNSHHLSFEQLPQDFKVRGLEAIERGQKLIKYGFVKPSQVKLNEIYRLILKEKKESWFASQKLRES